MPEFSSQSFWSTKTHHFFWSIFQSSLFVAQNKISEQKYLIKIFNSQEVECYK